MNDLKPRDKRPRAPVLGPRTDGKKMCVPPTTETRLKRHLYATVDHYVHQPEHALRGLGASGVARLNLLVNTVLGRQSFDRVSVRERVDLLQLALVAMANVQRVVVSLPQKAVHCLDLIYNILETLGRDPVEAVQRSRIVRWQLPAAVVEAQTLLESATHLYLYEDDLKDEPDLVHLRAMHQLLLVMNGQRDIFSCSHPLPDPQRLLYNVRKFYTRCETKRLLKEWGVEDVYPGVTAPEIAVWLSEVWR